jgi:hypothetical protein
MNPVRKHGIRAVRKNSQKAILAFSGIIKIDNR